MANNGSQTRTWKGRKKRNPIRHGKGAKSYRFSDKERDPEMMFLIERAENDARSDYKIANEAFISPGTLGAMVDGKTCRPQNATLTFLAKALGLRRLYEDENTGQRYAIPLWEDRIQRMKDKIAGKDA